MNAPHWLFPALTGALILIVWYYISSHFLRFWGISMRSMIYMILSAFSWFPFVGAYLRSFSGHFLEGGQKYSLWDMLRACESDIWALFFTRHFWRKNSECFGRYTSLKTIAVNASQISNSEHADNLIVYSEKHMYVHSNQKHLGSNKKCQDVLLWQIWPSEAETPYRTKALWFDINSKGCGSPFLWFVVETTRQGGAFSGKEGKSLVWKSLKVFGLIALVN